MTLPMSLRHEVEVDGEVIRLSPLIHRTVEVLLLNYPRWLSISALVERVYPDPDHEPDWAEDCVHLYLWKARAAGVPISGFLDRSIGYRIEMAGDRRSVANARAEQRKAA